MDLFIFQRLQIGTSEVLSVGDIVTCYVDEVFLDKGKVALSLIKNE